MSAGGENPFFRSFGGGQNPWASGGPGYMPNPFLQGGGQGGYMPNPWQRGNVSTGVNPFAQGNTGFGFNQNPFNWDMRRPDLMNQEKPPSQPGPEDPANGYSGEGDAFRADQGKLNGTRQWDTFSQEAAAESGVPVEVLRSIMAIESGGQNGLISAAGAKGLMQIVEFYANGEPLWYDLIQKYGGDPMDPRTNIRVGAQILKQYYDTYGDWELAAAAYLGSIEQDENGNWTPGRQTDAYGTDGVTYVGMFNDYMAAQGYSGDGSGSGSGGNMGASTAAQQLIGMKYVWGGESYDEGGFDCSGLTQYAYAQIGKNIPRTAEEQWQGAERFSDPTQLQPGDLVFFEGTTGAEGMDHVALYIGNGQMVNASSENSPIKIDRIDDAYWSQRLVGFGRY